VAAHLMRIHTHKHIAREIMNVTAPVNTFQCELISVIIVLYDANLHHYRVHRARQDACVISYFIMHEACPAPRKYK